MSSLGVKRESLQWLASSQVIYSPSIGALFLKHFETSINPNFAPPLVSSSGTRLHRGYVEEASPEDRPPQTTHVVFVVHGIGQKMDQGRIIKNTGM